jgi:hypothetical protein
VPFCEPEFIKIDEVEPVALVVIKEGIVAVPDASTNDALFDKMPVLVDIKRTVLLTFKLATDDVKVVVVANEGIVEAEPITA